MTATGSVTVTVTVTAAVLEMFPIHLKAVTEPAPQITMPSLCKCLYNYEIGQSLNKKPCKEIILPISLELPRVTHFLEPNSIMFLSLSLYICFRKSLGVF
eukprot:TRINITY_DN7429_c1_g1_i2.p1 TRINITY_DN7429_c1_g1~~TRINITY_DN7429_c1_g1_i2.p1  ORF type:complete len:100 (+),score=7.13 TRINITY_DN7429_c1_g1_i2:858-1157(+)